MSVVELVVATLLALAGVRSLATWIRREYRSDSRRGRLAYTLHVTARVGVWFAFAGFFAGYALVEEPQGFGWYLFVPLGLAGIQLLTGLYLGRPPGSAEAGGPGEA